MNGHNLDSLISLLDDPDTSVFHLVLEEILKEDVSVVDHLEHIWETSLDELLQNRIEYIIQQIQLNDTKEKINNWANQKTLDLFEGFFLISRHQYPELKLKSIQIQLDKIRKDIWLELRNSMTALEKITVINHIFFRKYKFSVDKKTPDSPQNCYINRILDTKKGNPVTITILYTLVAQSLNLPVQYIDFQKNPLVGYFDRNSTRKVQEEDPEPPVLFYINPSHKGAIIGPNEIDYIQPGTNLNDRKKLMEPSPDRIIIKRLVETLINAYNRTGALEKVNYLTDIAGIL